MTPLPVESVKVFVPVAEKQEVPAKPKAKRLAMGDVVTLKSGGPDMTVSEILPDGVVRCDWFSIDWQHQTSRFARRTLKPTEQ